MEKYLITGSSGFVAFHFLKFLDEHLKNVQVFGLDRKAPPFNIGIFKNISWNFIEDDLTDKQRIQNVINRCSPDYILHLAALSSVSFSWKEPVLSFINNTNIFLNLIEAVRNVGQKCRILSVGSSEEYGAFSENDLPLVESHNLNPVSPYAVARVAQEHLSKVYVDGFGLDIAMTRSFNHIGPGQGDTFVIPSVAKQLLAISGKSEKEGEIVTGDVTVIRDFLDVRDVVKAYYLLLREAKNGEVYNVCSGRGYSLADIIERMAVILDIKVRIKLNPELFRPSEIRKVIGSNEKLKTHTKWEMSYELEQSLKDVLVEYTCSHKDFCLTTVGACKKVTEPDEN